MNEHVETLAQIKSTIIDLSGHRRNIPRTRNHHPFAQREVRLLA